MLYAQYRSRILFGITVAFSLILIAIALTPRRPSYALPIYSRRYDVSCQTCHSVPPQLNDFGRAFQANHFNWPGGAPPAHRTGLSAFPISGLLIASSVHNLTANQTSTKARTLDLFISDGFSVNGSRTGGYFVDNVAAITDARAGDLHSAFIAVPVLGKRGQWAVKAGQFTAMTYQYDPLNSLTQSLPGALATGVAGFAATDPNPGVALDYFDRRGQGTADGNYVTLLAPVEGHLTLNKDSKLDEQCGFFAHAFHRAGEMSYGAFGYAHTGKHFVGLIGTLGLPSNIALLGVAESGSDPFGHSDLVSLQADYTPSPQLAVTTRLESVSATGRISQVYPVAAITYYPPLKLPILRLSAETIQARAARSVTVYAFVQF